MSRISGRANRTTSGGAGLSLALLAGAMISPALAVSLATTGPAQPLPDPGVATQGVTIVSLPFADNLIAGSASLMPVVAAELPAPATAIDTASPPGAGPTGANAFRANPFQASNIGKPIDDISFLAMATDSSRRESGAVHDALAQLQGPQLRRVAEDLIRTHEGINARMAKIAEMKSWPLPARPRHEAPPAGTASADFDGFWTDEMIATHERLAALYGAQAQGGEDPELRRFARDTLPTLQHHLTELRRLQK